MCVKCLYPAACSSSIKAYRPYADFNRTQRNKCACIPQIEGGESGDAQRVLFRHRTCMF